MFSSNGSQVSDSTFVEDVFSTYLYTGTGAAQTITNGIDLATKGGMVWTKSRSTGEHNLVCNDVGLGKWIKSNSTAIAQSFAPNGYAVPVFNTTGVTLSDSADQATSPEKYALWTFRKQPKFFDVVTYTGTGSNRTVAHNLGSVPGCIIVKDTSAVSNWYVYHRSLATNQALKLNSTAAIETLATFWNNTAATSTNFSLGTAGDVNGNGDTFVAYIFAHDAGGFGLTGADNAVSCGSFTTDGSGNATVSLGYEPQWIMYKSSSTAGGDWQIFDSMRGLTTSLDSSLSGNSSGAETTNTDWLTPSATGFSTVGAGFYTSATYIYIAIRRGPMKVPTLGTQVYTGLNATGGASYTTFNVGLDSDLILGTALAPYNYGTDVWSRLINQEYNDSGQLHTYSTDAVAPLSGTLFSDLKFDVSGGYRARYMKGNNTMMHLFKRAPGFMDVVAYTGTGATNAVNHNLAAPPEMIIVKGRNFTVGWTVGTNLQATQITLGLNSTSAENNPINNKYYFGNGTITVAPSATQFTVLTANINQNGNTFVAYLFATLAGVSKVGSYTGTGTTQTINCGFTGGARFVLIKRTDDTGDWYVWDSTRGIVAGNDPYVLLNSSAIEVTNTDYIDTYSAGFELSSTAPAAINANGGTYIFLAIA